MKSNKMFVLQRITISRGVFSLAVLFNRVFKDFPDDFVNEGTSRLKAKGFVDILETSVYMAPVRRMFQASVATAVLAAFFVFADPKQDFPATSSFMVYSVFLKV